MSLNNQNIIVKNDSYTELEIFSQPDLWIKLHQEYSLIKQQLRNYLKNFFNNADIRVILTGAGSSAFLGEVLLGIYSTKFKNPISAVATTDLVTHPELYFNKQNKYLLISFARSGNSPESSQAIILSEKLSKSVSHLIITCNNESELIESVSSKNKFVFLLPPEANDKGLAMTASFTSMLLAGLMISRINLDDDLAEQIGLLYKYGTRVLSTYSNDIQKAASLFFKRAVFLGSGMMKGIARESQLKLQELTDGKIICKYDSFMGFRHGPKAVIDEDTLIMYLFTNNQYSNLYEKDLVMAIANSRKNLFTIGVMEDNLNLPKLDLKILLSENGKEIHEEFLTVVSVLPAQLLGLYKSINLGLKPDTPSESGMIHRVVQGVNIYPYPNGIQ
ncbi:MAG: agaS [Ignavibacteriaceae bacterium]|nr:agaS [Ignavibacteriaceae bacterium]